MCLQETQEYTKTVVRYCLETLQIWFDAISFNDEVTFGGTVLETQISLCLCRFSSWLLFLFQPLPNQVTFHLPLHRYYAMFLSKVGLNCWDFSESEYTTGPLFVVVSAFANAHLCRFLNQGHFKKKLHYLQKTLASPCF